MPKVLFVSSLMPCDSEREYVEMCGKYRYLISSTIYMWGLAPVIGPTYAIPDVNANRTYASIQKV